GRECTRIVAGGEAADNARKRIEGVGVERVRDRRNPLRLQISDRLRDLVAELNAADALVALLNSGRFAVDFDLEPDPADACRLNRQVAGLAGNAGVSLVATDHRIQRAVAAHLFIDDDIDVNVAFGLEAGGQQGFDCHDMAGNTALHVGGTPAIDAAVLDGGGPGVVAPAFATNRDDISMPVQQQ